MAEAVVNIVIEQLVSAAAGWLQEEISLLKGVKTKLDNMKSKMQIIQRVVEDAENQSVKKKMVKFWVDKLQDVSYDMDDVLDEWSTRVHILEREEAKENNTSDEIVGSSSSCPTTCFSFKKLNCFSSIKQLPWRREIALRIKDINERIDSVFLEMKDFELASKVVGNDDLNMIINHISRTTTSSIDESKVYGRADDKDFLLRKVLSMNTEQEKSLQVISIVGAGGLGKTTLPQMVYNDEEVKQKFGRKRIWVCVSNPFDEVKVAKDILEGLKVDHSGMNNLQTLHQSVEEALCGDKFLLVLDDVWNEDLVKWEKLRICLKQGDPNSRILVTTRKEKVATIMDTAPTNILKPQHISDSDCWFLMSRIAFQGRTNTDNELAEIGKEIVKKCKGLPLAAKTLGGMLISKDTVDEWKKMLNSEIWELEQAEVELFPHIFLSYQELHAVLKRCFLILASFPKDTKLEVERVIAIWMANGFLNQGTKEDDMVNTGKKYIEFLVSRALLEEKHDMILLRDMISMQDMISMHDIMHDFALRLSGDEVVSIKVPNKIEINSSSELTLKGSSCLKSPTRHLYIEGNIDPASICFEVGKLRTCIIQNVAANTTADLVKGLQMVRALYLVDCDLEQVPSSIEHLIHLRLLDLSDNRLVELPETIGGLYNLQQLFLEGSGLSDNPLVKSPDDDALEKFPESVGKLINLHKLGRVLVGAGKNKLGLLEDLNKLRVLEIEFKSDYGDEVDAKKAEIGRKKHITKLEVYFNSHEVTNGVIAALQPHSNIQVLRLKWLPRNCDLLPNWITSLDHLTELHVSGGYVSTLPPLGKLRSLKKLYVEQFTGLKIIGREFMGIGSAKNCCAFPKLVVLEFYRCRELIGWEDLTPEEEEEEDSISVMPNLEQLMFKACYKLDKLPRRLLGQAPSLKTIFIIEEDSLFRFDVGESPRQLDLERSRQMLQMIVEGSTKVPTSIIYHSYITLLDIYFAKLPILYLPPMGNLPFLRSLSIRKFPCLQLIGRDFLGIDDPNNNEDFVAFPELLQLEIFHCGLLQWEDLKPEDEGKVTVMPKLQSLQITRCKRLQMLPSRLLCGAASLEELKCNDNNDSFAENIMKDEQLLRHVKSVYVNEQQCSLHPSTKSENERGSGTINSS